MKAFRLTEWQKPPRIVDVPVPEAGPGQVLVKIGGAGACHSDLHLMEWPAGMLPWKLPFTLGHENAGWVEQVGAGVSGFAKGDAVLVYGPWGCGGCKPCRLGRENYCAHAAEIVVSGGGLGLDGGMADYLLVPSARHLVAIGDLDPAHAAPLTDAALTPYHAIKHSLPLLEAGSTAVVIGAGGLGQTAVQLLRLLSPSRIVAVDKDAAKLELAKSFGADVVLPSDTDSATAIRRMAPAGVELVLDCVGADATLALGAKLLRAEGHLTIVGLAMGTLPLNFFSVPYGATVRTTYWGTAPELIELVALARAGKITQRIETYPLDRAAEVYERLRTGQVAGRAVVVP